MKEKIATELELLDAEIWDENSLVVPNDGRIFTDEELMEGERYFPQMQGDIYWPDCE